MNKVCIYYLSNNKVRLSSINSYLENKKITVRNKKSMSCTDKMDEIEKEVLNCRKCSLYKTRNKTVFGKGACKQPDIVFVGEAPGADEDRIGLPFVGRGGRLFDTWLLRYKLDLNSVYIMNAIKCRPPQNRDPLDEEKDACRDFFVRQIEFLRPKVICALGRHGFSNLVPMNFKDTFSSMRGRVHSYNNIPVVATYHPAYILRNSSAEYKVFEDFDLLLSTLKLH